MSLEDHLHFHLKKLGITHYKKMFGWICIMVGKHFIGGYKVLDESVIILFLVLSPEMYEEALKNGSFTKFQFGKTWVEIEINNEETINEILSYIKDAFIHSKIRK